MRSRWLGALILGLPLTAGAQGINTNVALPVAVGEGIWRSQLRFTRATNDLSPANRKRRVLAMPQTLVLGVTPRLTAFTTLPILARRRTSSLLGSIRTESALGDVTLLGRYTVWWDDYAPLSTRRAALLAGVKLPTGADRFGTKTYDPLLGAVATWAEDRHELDVDALYSISTERKDFRRGNRLRYDLAYRYRIWPRRFGRRLLQLNSLLELNGLWTDRDRSQRTRVSDSGGHVIFVSPGLQLAAKTWILELSLQLPVFQELHGPQIKKAFVAVLSVRIPFEVYD
ncbi:MAG: hypothetical protein ACE5FG_10525 [Myxococcota bacterium]